MGGGNLDGVSQLPMAENPTSHSAVYTSDFGSLIDKINKVENIYFFWKELDFGYQQRTSFICRYFVLCLKAAKETSSLDCNFQKRRGQTTHKQINEINLIRVFTALFKHWNMVNYTFKRFMFRFLNQLTVIWISLIPLLSSNFLCWFLYEILSLSYSCIVRNPFNSV